MIYACANNVAHFNNRAKNSLKNNVKINEQAKVFPPFEWIYGLILIYDVE